jgi:hypothetical protein
MNISDRSIFFIKIDVFDILVCSSFYWFCLLGAASCAGGSLFSVLCRGVSAAASCVAALPAWGRRKHDGVNCALLREVRTFLLPTFFET